MSYLFFLHVPYIFIFVLFQPENAKLILQPSISQQYLFLFIYPVFFNSCRRLPETKRHSSLFLH